MVLHETHFAYVFGVLEKRSQYLRSWNKRWFWLRASTRPAELLYYKNAPVSLDTALRNPYGRVDLSGYFVDVSEKHSRHVIVLRNVSSTKETLYLAASDRASFVVWVNGFQKAIHPPCAVASTTDDDGTAAVGDIHRAVFRSDHQSVRRLLDEGHDVNVIDLHGNTPLHIAIMRGDLTIAQLLLEHDASTVIRNHARWTAMNEATSRGDRDFIRCLWQVRQSSIKEFLRERGSVLLGHFAGVDDFYMQLEWKFSSWLPVVSQLCPSDSWRIWKKGNSIRIDTHLKGFDFPRWKRGNLTFLFQLNPSMTGEVHHPPPPPPPPSPPPSSSSSQHVTSKLVRANTAFEIGSDSDILKGGHMHAMAAAMHSAENVAEAIGPPIIPPSSTTTAAAALLSSTPPAEAPRIIIDDTWQLSLAMDHDVESYHILYEDPEGEFCKQRGDSEVMKESKSDLNDEERVIEAIEDDIDLLMTAEMSHIMLSKRVKFQPVKPKVVGVYDCVVYKVCDFEMNILKRREHLTAEQIRANKEVLESVRNPSKLTASVRELGGIHTRDERSHSPGSRSHLATVLARGERQHEPSRARPTLPNITEAEYFSHALKRRMLMPPHLGRPMVLKTKKKAFVPKVSMTQRFPLKLQTFLSVLELVSSQLPHVTVVKEFLEGALPPGFPVRVQIPIFPTISVTLSVSHFSYEAVDRGYFVVPTFYKNDPNMFDFLMDDSVNT